MLRLGRASSRIPARAASLLQTPGGSGDGDEERIELAGAEPPDGLFAPALARLAQVARP